MGTLALWPAVSFATIGCQRYARLDREADCDPAYHAKGEIR